jgi:hypothetical protein
VAIHGCFVLTFISPSAHNDPAGLSWFIMVYQLTSIDCNVGCVHLSIQSNLIYLCLYTYIYIYLFIYIYVSIFIPMPIIAYTYICVSMSTSYICSSADIQCNATHCRQYITLLPSGNLTVCYGRSPSTNYKWVISNGNVKLPEGNWLRNIAVF